MRTIIAILATILIMLQLFFYCLCDAVVYWGYDIHGNMLCDIEVGGYRFNYTQHDINDHTIYKGV